MLELVKLGKTYIAPSGPLPILAGIDLSLNPGDALAIMGPSGSGKSTLLHIMGALDTPTEGSISLDNRSYSGMKDTEQAAFRSQHVGFVFQDHSLLAQCSVLENVMVPTLIAEKAEPFEQRARQLLQTVGLESRLDHRPAQLSGGEKQRVAIARALIRKPKLLLCDEPTGNLDRKSADGVGSLLLDLAREKNAILVVVTHSPELASKFSARYELVERGLRKV